MKQLRPIMVLLGALIALIAALAVPANAAGNRLQETSGSFDVGAPDLSEFAPVVETADGRAITLVPAGTHQVKIRFDANTTLCVAGANNGLDVTVHLCDANAIVWTEIFNNGHIRFLNNHFGLYLCGRDDGSQFLLEQLDQGFFCQFDLT